MRVILLIRKRTLCVSLLLCCFCAAVALAGWQPGFTAVMAEQGSGYTVIIDPGHGGEDGGAVSPDGVEEGTVNLAVSLRLEGLLRFAGVPVEMTRRTDEMVCDQGLSTLRQRKVSDIHNRVDMVNAVPNAVLLSIHQNSLPSSPETHGAQAFWNRGDGAEQLAAVLQTELNSTINTHRAKELRVIDPGIYLMNHVTAPAVLVECGFLSNREETVRLQQEAYQMTLAAVIAAGYLRWAAGGEQEI